MTDGLLSRHTPGLDASLYPKVKQSLALLPSP